MSIPPLVCSTPPPPDQCEDDKDVEDFDLQYNSSQDEDENNDFSYGNFSTYNHFQHSVSSRKKEEAITNDKDSAFETENKSEISKENNDCIVLNKNVKCETDSKCEEDINIEDLNLKFDQESLESNIKDDQEENEISKQDDYSVEEKLSNIPETSSTSPDEMTRCSSPTPSYKFAEVSTNESNTEKQIIFVEDIIENEVNVLNADTTESNLVVNKSDDREISDVKTQIEFSLETKNTEDDIGDFDDFNFVKSENIVITPIDNCDNPWRHDETVDSDFSDFKANFDEHENSLQNPHVLVSRSSNESNNYANLTEQNICQNNDDDDDFGDFDDFKSSTIKTEVNENEESLSCQQVPVLNLHTPDNEIQVIESINKVLSCIFEHEISEPESNFERKLESLLSETWGHLIETDVRQPYIVNWNNSMAQKTLLKALCIDSRNILFGPKWSCNMPKYAVNLSTAPLQPQKQANSLPQSEVVNTDKASIKVADSWTDPFTSEGQESCNTENDDTVVEPRPTDLDVFEASISTKSDKMYSTTINVQPLRQINLPDTHIFTPTDSETPRSKTIHYDCGPPMLLPQVVIENHKDQSGKLASQDFGDVIVNNIENDIEYSDFQDFKTSSNINTLDSTSKQLLGNSVETAMLNNTIPNTKITLETQILQPIKVEPIMPTLNWPDPGKVKAFDDFTDFVSNSSWNIEKKDRSSTQNSIENSKTIIDNDKLHSANINNEIKVNYKSTTKIDDTFDDEFDTFQSALPPIKNIPFEFNTSNLSNDTAIKNHSQDMSQTASSIMTTFDIAFPKIYNIKSDTISFSNVSNESSMLNQMSFIPNDLDNVSTAVEVISKSSQLQSTGPQMTDTNLLQPTPVNAAMITQNQQKSGQILQPLSLESFSQINWPNPGIDLQDLSRFNPMETFQSLKSDLSASGHSKVTSPVHSQKSLSLNQVSDDDIWGEYVSSKPKIQQTMSNKQHSFIDDDEWTDFVSSPTVKPQNGLNTISLNVHTNLSMQKSTNPNKFTVQNKQVSLDIPTLNYITPKSNNHKTFNDRHFQNL